VETTINNMRRDVMENLKDIGKQLYYIDALETLINNKKIWWPSDTVKLSMHKGSQYVDYDMQLTFSPVPGHQDDWLINKAAIYVANYMDKDFVATSKTTVSFFGYTKIDNLTIKVEFAIEPVPEGCIITEQPNEFKYSFFNIECPSRPE